MPSIFNYNFFDLDIFVGASYINRIDNHGLLYSLYNMILYNDLKISNINVVSAHLGRISMSEVGMSYTLPSHRLYSQNVNMKKFIYLCGADTEQLLNGNSITESSFIVYLGPYSPVNDFLNKINIILPTSIYSEENEHYLNLEGRLRKTTVAIPPSEPIRSISTILNSLYHTRTQWVLDNYSRYSNFLKEVVNNSKIKYISHYDEDLYLSLCAAKEYTPYVLTIDVSVLFRGKNMFSSDVFDRNIFNYYISDCYATNSSVMMSCSSKIRYVNFQPVDNSNIKF